MNHTQGVYPSAASFGGAIGAEQMRQDVRQASQMESVTNRLSACTAELQGVFDQLCARLEPILTPAPKNATGNGPVPVPIRCSLAVAIDCESDRMCALRDQMREVMDRLAI